MAELVSVAGVDEQIEIGNFLIEHELFDFSVPCLEDLFPLEVVEVVEACVTRRKIHTLEAIFDGGVEIVLALLIERAT
jgi:hypothetical protein